LITDCTNEPFILDNVDRVALLAESEMEMSCEILGMN
jgi:hypothetical protein